MTWRGTARPRGETESGGPSLGSSRAGATRDTLTVSVILATCLTRTTWASTTIASTDTSTTKPTTKPTSMPTEATTDACEWQPLPALPWTPMLLCRRAPLCAPPSPGSLVLTSFRTALLPEVASGVDHSSWNPDQRLRKQ